MTLSRVFHELAVPAITTLARTISWSLQDIHVFINVARVDNTLENKDIHWTHYSAYYSIIHITRPYVY